MLKHIIATFLIAFVLLYVGIECALGFGFVSTTGATFDLRSGAVMAVAPGSAAARAGIRAGDRVDFARAGWLVHLSLDRTGIVSNHAQVLPLLRRGRPFTATLWAGAARPPADAWVDFVNAAAALLYASLGGVLYFLRRTNASLALFVFCCGCSVQVGNLVPALIAAPSWVPAALFVGTIGPSILDVFGNLYFGLLFANQASSVRPAWRYVILPAIVVQTALYYYHFYGLTIWPQPFNTFLVFAVLQWLIFAVAAIAITIRIARDAQAARLRWVAVGIWASGLITAIFIIDQNMVALGSQGHAFIIGLFAWVQPMPLCIAYVLLRTRVIDARVVGARTIVYGLLTIIPIGLFSIADWFFSRKLADARLATVAEFGIAVIFGVWLNTLHKRIDRFVERIVFSSRHQGFTRIRNALHAMSAVERSSTVYTMLTEGCGQALNLASAALFVARTRYERVAGYGWDGCSQVLDPDDAAILFARAHGRPVRIADFAPSSSALPAGDAAPEVAVPIVLRQGVYGIALYGRHSGGEHIDAGEEDLLAELAHAAASALERLHADDQIAELQAQNALLLARAANPA